jgi:hypothetical protein
VHFGPALDFSGRCEDERSASALREVTEAVRAAVQELSGQRYVTSYGNAVKATLAAESAASSGLRPAGDV